MSNLADNAHSLHYTYIDVIFVLITVITIYKGWIRGVRSSAIITGAICIGLVASKLLQTKILIHLHNTGLQQIGALIVVIFGGLCGYAVGNIIAGFLGHGMSEGIGGWCNRIGGATIHTSAFLLATWLLCIGVASVTSGRLQHDIARSATIQWINAYAPIWLRRLPGEVDNEIFIKN